MPDGEQSQDGAGICDPCVAPGVFVEPGDRPETGQFKAPQRHISKRGSPYLRKTLWLMAHRAVYQEGDLRTYWLAKRAAGLHYLSAVTAAAIKLTRVCWRILTDQRDYLPEGRPTQRT